MLYIKRADANSRHWDISVFCDILGIIFTILVVFGKLPVAIAADRAHHLRLETGGHQAPIHAIDFSADGRYLFSASDDKTLRMWDVQSHRLVKVFRGQSGRGHDGKLLALAVSPDNHWLAVAGWLSASTFASSPCCGDIRVYDLRTGRMASVLRGHADGVNSLAFSHDGQFLISGSSDKTARIWNMKELSEVRRLGKHGSRVNAVQFSANGLFAVTGTQRGALSLWRLDRNSPAHLLVKAGKPITALDTARTGHLAVGRMDGSIKIWDSVRIKPLARLPKLQSSIGALRFTPDGSKLLSTCGFPCADGYHQYVWDMADGKPLHRYDGHDNTVIAAAISPDGKWAATAGGEDHEIHIWDIATGKLAQRLKGQGSSVWSVGVSPRGGQIFWGNEDPCPKRSTCPNKPGTLQWSLKFPKKDQQLLSPKVIDKIPANIIRARDRFGLFRIDHHKGGQDKLPDGVLELRRGSRKFAAIVRGRSSGLRHSAYSFSGDGKFFFSGGAHGVLTAYLVDKNQRFAGQDIADLVGHTNQIWAMAATPDSRFLITGSADKTVRLWNIAPDNNGDLSTGELVLSIFHTKNGEWVMWTPEGFYASSPNGDRFVGWQINRGPSKDADYVTAAQLKRHFYRPDIIRDAIAMASARAAIKKARTTEPKRFRFTVAELLQITPPEVEIPGNLDGRNFGADTILVTIRATSRNTPITTLRAMVNGAIIHNLSFHHKTRFHYRESLDLPLRQGRNRIKITVGNYAGDTSTELFVTRKSTTTTKIRGALHILAIGINNYHPDLGVSNLKNAEADAHQFAKTLAAKSRSGKGVSVELLTTKHGALPTAANIRTALERIRQRSKPHDTVVIFLAGHGLNEGGRYWFPTVDSKWTANNHIDPQTAISWEDLEGFIGSIKGNRILFIDTCHGAGSYNSRLVKDSQDQNLALMSASETEAFAYEPVNGKHGYFTAALLKGIGSGLAEDNRFPDGKIQLHELAVYVKSYVRHASDGLQRPQSFIEFMEDFVIAEK